MSRALRSSAKDVPRPCLTRLLQQPVASRHCKPVRHWLQARSLVLCPCLPSLPLTPPTLPHTLPPSVHAHGLRSWRPKGTPTTSVASSGGERRCTAQLSYAANPGRLPTQTPSLRSLCSAIHRQFSSGTLYKQALTHAFRCVRPCCCSQGEKSAVSRAVSFAWQCQQLHSSMQVALIMPAL